MPALANMCVYVSSTTRATIVALPPTGCVTASNASADPHMSAPAPVTEKTSSVAVALPERPTAPTSCCDQPTGKRQRPAYANDA